jgi:mRNA interferase RelE/StbE
MKHDLYWFHRAVEDIAQLSARNSKQATRILVALREFAQTNRGDVKKLQGKDRWRLRVGDWRVGLELEGSEAWVIEVTDRQDAYP